MLLSVQAVNLSPLSLHRRFVISATLQTPLTPEELAAVDRQHANRWWVLAIIALAQVMVILDATVVNIALPDA